MPADPTDVPLTRRTFVKGLGAAVGAATMGSAVPPAAAGDATLDADMQNYRVAEARKVWDRGYTGHPERTIGLTDTGIDVRHPDVGPWNGMTTALEDGEFMLSTGESIRTREKEPLAAYARETDWEGIEEEDVRFEGFVTGGTFVDHEVTETVLGTFGPDGEGEIPADADALTAKLYWDLYEVEVAGVGEDNINDLELRIDRQTEDGEWVEHAYMATADMPEIILETEIDPGETYRYVAEPYKHFAGNAWMEELFLSLGPVDVLASEGESFDAVGHDMTAPEDKVVGWHDSGVRYGINPEPADPNGHGTHVSSIMAGTGEASAVDPDRLTVEEPHAVLAAGDHLEYEVEALPGTGVFAVAYGDVLELVVEGPDGQVLRREGPPSTWWNGTTIYLDYAYTDSSLNDNNVISHPTVHESGEATYTVIVRPTQGDEASTSRVEKVAVGTFEDPDEAVGRGASTLHAGIAPDQRIFGFQGLSGPLSVLEEHGDAYAEWFGLRSVNMSWSYGTPVPNTTPPYGSAGGELTDDVVSVRRMAEQGILTVAAGSNSATPGQTSVPALADEAISVVSTGPRDGLVEYTSGGMVAEDEDDDGRYVKPDVAAPGGQLDNGVMAAKAEANDFPFETDDRVDDVRAYTRAAGTSMASPFTNGVVGLLSEAMEVDAPDSIALPEPAETGLDDLMRLKQVLLATATETAFTAAPYHRGHAPTYDFGERDIYEGYGRVNPDAAVDAVTRDLLPDLPDAAEIEPGETAEAIYHETAGLDVPMHSRAFAGYVDVRGGTLEVSVDISHYTGGDRGSVTGLPHVDLFVYDAEEPADHGEPNVVAASQGVEGFPSVTVEVDRRDSREDEPNTRTFLVVAKLVNVPGSYNGEDIQGHFDMTVRYEAADELPLPSFSASGTREDDGRAFTQGATNSIDVTVEAFSDGVTAVSVTDHVPEGWTLLPYADSPYDEPHEGPVDVELGTVVRADLGSEDATRSYIVEATGGTGGYEFGPAEATIESTEDDAAFENDTAELVGTETNYIVGVDQNDPAGSAADGGSSAGDGGSSATDGFTDTVEDTL